MLCSCNLLAKTLYVVFGHSWEQHSGLWMEGIEGIKHNEIVEHILGTHQSSKLFWMSAQSTNSIYRNSTGYGVTSAFGNGIPDEGRKQPTKRCVICRHWRIWQGFSLIPYSSRLMASVFNVVQALQVQWIVEAGCRVWFQLSDLIIGYAIIWCWFNSSRPTVCKIKLRLNIIEDSRQQKCTFHSISLRLEHYGRDILYIYILCSIDSKSTYDL